MCVHNAQDEFSGTLPILILFIYACLDSRSAFVSFLIVAQFFFDVAGTDAVPFYGWFYIDRRRKTANVCNPSIISK